MRFATNLNKIGLACLETDHSSQAALKISKVKCNNTLTVGFQEKPVFLAIYEIQFYLKTILWVDIDYEYLLTYLSSVFCFSTSSTQKPENLPCYPAHLKVKLLTA